MKKALLTIIILTGCYTLTWAQRHIIYSNDIASLQVVAGTSWQEMPIVYLGNMVPINIDFDELSHEYHRYVYRLVHLEWNWKDSEGLIDSDYMTGLLGSSPLEDYKLSINTSQDYTHYHLQIPNSDCQIRMSGNYRLDIIDDNASDDDDNGDGIGDNVVLSAFFMVAEQGSMNVGIDYDTNTDIDFNKSHQQVHLKVDYSKLGTNDPRGQIKGYVLQNGRWDNAIRLPQSTSINQQYLEWSHCRTLIFDGGNEYHKFEILDIHRNSFNVESNTWDKKAEIWNTWVYPDEPRRAYTHDETPKGAFYIRNTDNYENDYSSEYVLVHFTLKAEEQCPYPVYLNGNWTYDRFQPQYQMHYNPVAKEYEGEVRLKYGYYSYQYLMLNGNTTAIPPTEGNFFETTNKYTALMYYRGYADRADRLVGFATTK